MGPSSRVRPDDGLGQPLSALAQHLSKHQGVRMFRKDAQAEWVLGMLAAWFTSSVLVFWGLGKGLVP